MQNSSIYPDHLPVLSRALLCFFSDNLSRNSCIQLRNALLEVSRQLQPYLSDELLESTVQYLGCNKSAVTYLFLQELNQFEPERFDCEYQFGAVRSPCNL